MDDEGRAPTGGALEVDPPAQLVDHDFAHQGEPQAGPLALRLGTDAHNLWERVKKYETAVLLFAKLPHVSFTNNRAERDLRMSKVKQKVSGCFRTTICAEAYCRVSSYLQTMASKGYNPLIAIQMALSGQIYAEGGE